ncbi:Rgg family transcriptional regulator [Companilactobacillus sp. HBUAS56257]|uniref:Rgg family transcriptional regulator n=1 Tax=Companilactobacillus sp. HBUAS56257 TaxID=3109360 RepID=UPI002FF146DB
MENLSTKFKQDLSNELNKSEDWANDEVFLQLFGSSMLIFSLDRLNVYMKKIISVYENTIDKHSFVAQRRIAGICINYLNRSYKENDYTYLNETLQLIKALSENPDLLMYKILGLYFDSLFKKDKSLQESILSMLTQAGYGDFIQNLPK